MSVALYDKALLAKLQKWIVDDTVAITGVNETRRLFEYKADTIQDKPIKLPLITLRREPTIHIESTNKKPITFDGYRKNNNGTKGDQLNAIPMSINYQIDIYTRYMEEAEEYVRNFVFNLINFPKLEIEIPYNNAKIMHNSNIYLSPDIQDNSDIPERLIPDQFTRYTISIYIDDAYLFDYKIKDDWRIDLDSTVDTKLSLNTELSDNKN